MAEKEQDKINDQDSVFQSETPERTDGETGAAVSRGLSDEDVFCAKGPEFGQLSSETQRIIDTPSKPGRHYSRFQIMMMLNAVALVWIIGFVLLVRWPGTPSPSNVPGRLSDQPSVSIQPVKQMAYEDLLPVSQLSMKLDITEKEADALDKAVSLHTAKELYKQQDYQKACYMFKKLRGGLLGDGLREECLRDWLSLQMALCLQRMNDYAMMDELFTQVLNSKSIVVRAMANYRMALVHSQNQQFYESYGRIYQTLALLDAFEKWMPPAMEADCYFIAAESLTRHILRMNNSGGRLPGSSWVDHMELYELPFHSQAQLSELLMAGIEDMNAAALMPKVAFSPNRKVGMQWTLTCLNASAEQVFWQFASESDLPVNLEGKTQGFHNHEITAYISFVDRHYLAEVIAASAGLIWQYDGRGGTIYDPSGYRDFDDLQQILVQESVSMWRRFLIRYRNNRKIPNAHFCLGRLYTISDEKSMALGAYKLVSTQFDRDALAAHALFNTAMIKVDMRNYKGAREDLNELLIRYPDCTIVNEALLYLADVLIESNFYQESAQIYNRVYHLNLNDEARRKSLFGLGRCAYEMDDFEESAKQFTEALKMTPDKSDDRVGAAYLMLGQAFIEMGQYTQASGVLRMALGGKLDNHEYVQTILELAKVECKQEHYLQALNVLDSIPQERLSQEDSCQVLIAKVDVYRVVGLLDTAVSLLRRQIEYIADASLRARLSLELAHCYLLNDDLRIAEKELNDAMYDLPVGYDSQRGGYLLARIAFLQANYNKAENLCLRNLETDVENETLCRQIHQLLGDTYTKQKNYRNAALAFAGISDQDTFQ